VRVIGIGGSMGVALLTTSCGVLLPPLEPPAPPTGAAYEGLSPSEPDRHEIVAVRPAARPYAASPYAPGGRRYVIVLMDPAEEPPIVVFQHAPGGASDRLATPSSRPFKPSPYEEAPRRARQIDEDSPYP
jgi:hypothetical protein